MCPVLSKPDRPAGESLLLDVADVLATSLDLDTTVRRVAEIVRKVIDYEIFAILLLNEKTQELRFRFQVGYPPEFAERSRVKVGEGVTGRAAQLRQPILIDDVTEDPRYIAAVPNVRSELAIPLITKSRVIGVIDIEARERVKEKLPTCGLVVIDFSFDDWSRLHTSAGRLERFVSPRLIAAAQHEMVEFCDLERKFHGVARDYSAAARENQ
jgi:putative methionine-R-sulfoxide reductase with GAF domain